MKKYDSSSSLSLIIAPLVILFLPPSIISLSYLFVLEASRIGFELLRYVETSHGVIDRTIWFTIVTKF